MDVEKHARGVIMANKTKYNTLSQATSGLLQKGYQHNVVVESSDEAKINGKFFHPDQLKIDEVHRFEGMTNPSDSSVCYAVSCADGNKGIIVDAYGADASKFVDNFIKKVGFKSNNEIL